MFHGLVVGVKMRVIVDLESLGIEGRGDLRGIVSGWFRRICTLTSHLGSNKILNRSVGVAHG